MRAISIMGVTVPCPGDDISMISWDDVMFLLLTAVTVEVTEQVVSRSRVKRYCHLSLGYISANSPADIGDL